MWTLLSYHLLPSMEWGVVKCLEGFSAAPKGLLWFKEACQPLQKLPKVALSWILVAAGASEWQQMEVHCSSFFFYY